MTTGISGSAFGTPMASQTNLRELAQAKSRTFSARKVQVRVPSTEPSSAAAASAGLTM